MLLKVDNELLLILDHKICELWPKVNWMWNVDCGRWSYLCCCHWKSSLLGPGTGKLIMWLTTPGDGWYSVAYGVPDVCVNSTWCSSLWYLNPRQGDLIYRRYGIQITRLVPVSMCYSIAMSWRWDPEGLSRAVLIWGEHLGYPGICALCDHTPLSTRPTCLGISARPRFVTHLLAFLSKSQHVRHLIKCLRVPFGTGAGIDRVACFMVRETVSWAETVDHDHTALPGIWPPA